MHCRRQCLAQRIDKARLHSTREILHNTKPSTWERSAHLVKNISVTNQYLEHIRESHDPALQLKTIEDELKGTIGKALGKAGEKITRAIRSMEEEKLLYNQWLKTHIHDDDSTKNMSDGEREEIEMIVTRYNNFRKQALQARWELIIHRQAIGFTVNNQKTVFDTYPIHEPLVVPFQVEEDTNEQERSKESKKQFTDQLDWWQRIGRWR
jgi:ribosome-binding ATPase YchF (GTP1/OBG family)